MTVEASLVRKIFRYIFINDLVRADTSCMVLVCANAEITKLWNIQEHFYSVLFSRCFLFFFRHFSYFHSLFIDQNPARGFNTKDSRLRMLSRLTHNLVILIYVKYINLPIVRSFNGSRTSWEIKRSRGLTGLFFFSHFSSMPFFDKQKWQILIRNNDSTIT